MSLLVYVHSLVDGLCASVIVSRVGVLTVSKPVHLVFAG